jgi:hypothetical protein
MGRAAFADLVLSNDNKARFEGMLGKNAKSEPKEVRKK